MTSCYHDVTVRRAERAAEGSSDPGLFWMGFHAGFVADEEGRDTETVLASLMAGDGAAVNGYLQGLAAARYERMPVHAVNCRCARCNRDRLDRIVRLKRQAAQALEVAA